MSLVDENAALRERVELLEKAAAERDASAGAAEGARTWSDSLSDDTTPAAVRTVPGDTPSAPAAPRDLMGSGVEYGARGGHGGRVEQDWEYDVRPARPSVPIPKFVSRKDGSVNSFIGWRRRMPHCFAEFELSHTILPNNPAALPVITCSDDTHLARTYGAAVVTQHRRAWSILSEAIAGATFENTLHRCDTVFRAWTTIADLNLPKQPAERHLCLAQLANLQMGHDEHPKRFFERVVDLETILEAVGVVKDEEAMVQILLRSLSSRYEIQKASTLSGSNLSRAALEDAAYSRNKAEEIWRKGATAVPASPSVTTPAPGAPPNPHALVVGRGFGSGDTGGSSGAGQRQGGGLRYGRGQRSSYGYGAPRQQQQWHGGGSAPQQQKQPPPQQQWYGGGGTPRQQSYSPSSHPRQQQYQQFTPPQQQQQQGQRQQFPQQQPQGYRRSQFGLGGLFDNGSNAVYPQEDSALPTGAPMGTVHRCGRCGRNGHTPDICAALRRFEGICGVCGQYGYMGRNCKFNNIGCTVIYKDDVGTIHLANNPATSPNSKHIDIRHHFVRERVSRGEFTVVHVPSHLQRADFLTKPLRKEIFFAHRDFVMNIR